MKKILLSIILTIYSLNATNSLIELNVANEKYQKQHNISKTTLSVISSIKSNNNNFLVSKYKNNKLISIDYSKKWFPSLSLSMSLVFSNNEIFIGKYQLSSKTTNNETKLFNKDYSTKLFIKKYKVIEEECDTNTKCILNKLNISEYEYEERYKLLTNKKVK